MVETWLYTSMQSASSEYFHFKDNFQISLLLSILTLSWLDTLWFAGHKLIHLPDIDRIALAIDVATPVHFSWSLIIVPVAGTPSVLSFCSVCSVRYPWAPPTAKRTLCICMRCLSIVCARLCVIYAHVSISARDVGWIFYCSLCMHNSECPRTTGPRRRRLCGRVLVCVGVCMCVWGGGCEIACEIFFVYTHNAAILSSTTEVITLSHRSNILQT